MAYTTIDKPSDYFDINLRSGTGSQQTVTGMDFQPDWIWSKLRSGGSGYHHALVDSVRGGTKKLFTSATNAESTDSNAVTSFNSDGYTYGSSGSFNLNGGTYVHWCWKAGTSFSNSAGANGADIASSGSVNTTAGFSIVKWVGNGTDDQQISHGLSSTVKMILCKRYIGGSPDAWAVYHVGLPVTQYLVLNTDVAGQSDNEVIWSDEHPTSSVFTVGNHGMTNDSGSTMIGYCFADVKGYSKIGSYTGNGNADGTFVYLGFKPAFVMCKRTDDVRNWVIVDNKRPNYNPTNEWLYPNASDAGYSQTGIDLLSNGFKTLITSPTVNASGGSYIYMAFAENPFVTSSGVPTTAR